MRPTIINVGPHSPFPLDGGRVGVGGVYADQSDRARKVPSEGQRRLQRPSAPTVHSPPPNPPPARGRAFDLAARP